MNRKNIKITRKNKLEKKTVKMIRKKLNKKNMKKMYTTRYVYKLFLFGMCIDFIFI